MSNTKLKSIGLQAVLLFGFWLVLSGTYDLLHISLGFISVIIVMLINGRLNNHTYFEDNKQPRQQVKFLRLFYFFPLLIWEIISSSIKIAFLILHPAMPIKTGLINFKAELPHMNARAILGNSLSLTPGLITIDIKEDIFLVHSLTGKEEEEFIDHSLIVEISKLYPCDPEKIVTQKKVITTLEEF